MVLWGTVDSISKLGYFHSNNAMNKLKAVWDKAYLFGRGKCCLQDVKRRNSYWLEYTNIGTGFWLSLAVNSFFFLPIKLSRLQLIVIP